MTPLSKIIAEEIRKNGPISMARFMERALYCPVYGYYERSGDIVGRRGDFQTNVSVGPVFGEILAARFVRWSEELSAGTGARLQWVEVGAHDGRLAHDILTWLATRRPDLIERIDYGIVEPSGQRQAAQQRRLRDFGRHVRWVSSLDALRTGRRGLEGILFSNELLDAQPVSRFAWDARHRDWFEWRVARQDDQFIWIRGGPPSRSDRRTLGEIVPARLLDVLPDSYIIDLSPGATEWWRQAVGILDRGRVLTFDYGFETLGAVTAERAQGTLRGYRRHQVVDDVLASPGEQDITAHVHFDQIRKAGEEAGARTDYFGAQERFLVEALSEAQASAEYRLDLDDARVRQFKTLIHPNHFGRLFKVLVQSKG